MRTQRWTLSVVCAATAMLMLDIAVVNTALSRIAEDLNTGLIEALNAARAVQGVGAAIMFAVSLALGRAGEGVRERRGWSCCAARSSR